MKGITRLIAGVSTLALTGFLTAPAFAAVTVITDGSGTDPKPIVVKWNTLLTATILLNANYSLTNGTGQAAAGTILQSTATGLQTTGCATAPPAGADAFTDDFGSGSTTASGITPDPVKPISCLFEKAVDAIVTTNSTNWTVTEKLSTALPAAPGGWALCAYPGAKTTTLPLTYTAPATTAFDNVCTGGTSLTTAASASLFTGTAGGTYYLPQDLALGVPPAATAAAGTTSIIYTLTAN